FDQIGLAGAIGAREHHRSGSVERDLRGVIAAEVGQPQTSNKGGGHRYSSCRPAPDIKSSGIAQYQRRRWPGQARPSKMQTRFAVYTRIGISTYSAPFASLSWIRVGEPGSASFSTATSPSSWAAMSSR